MKVKITRQPYGAVQGLSLNYYRTGEVYDLPPSLAEYLVVQHYAIFEMRHSDKAPGPIERERRRSM